MPPETTKKRGRGRPPAADPLRYAIRHDFGDRQTFELAAATCGMSLNAWILATLRAEASKATHVPMAKREGRRG